MSEFRRFACPDCLGSGKVFQCDKWVASNGACCAPDARRDDCSSQRVTCRACNGTGLRGYNFSASRE